MTTAKPRSKPATLADLEALSADVRGVIIEGVLDTVPLKITDWWPPVGSAEGGDEI